MAGKFNNENVNKINFNGQSVHTLKLNNSIVWEEPYTLTISTSNGSYIKSYSVSRTATKEPTASTGALSNGATIYYDDTLSTSCTPADSRYTSWSPASISNPTFGSYDSRSIVVNNPNAFAVTLSYGTTSAVGTDGGTIAANSSKTISSLTPNTTYYFKLTCASSTRTRYDRSVSASPASVNSVTGAVTITFTGAEDSGHTETRTITSIASQATRPQYTITWSWEDTFGHSTTTTEAYDYNATPSRTSPSTVTSGNTRHVFTQWDSLAKVTANRTITAQYKTQYNVTITPNCCTANRSTGWNDAGTVITWTADANHSFAGSAVSDTSTNTIDTAGATYSRTPGYTKVSISGTRCTFTPATGTLQKNGNDGKTPAATITWTASTGYSFTAGTTQDATRTATVTTSTGYSKSADYKNITVSSTNCTANVATGYRQLNTNITWTASTGYHFGTDQSKTTDSEEIVAGTSSYSRTANINTYSITVSCTNCTCTVGGTARASGWSGTVNYGTSIVYTRSTGWSYTTSHNTTETKTVTSAGTYSSSPDYCYLTVNKTNCTASPDSGWYKASSATSVAVVFTASTNWSFGTPTRTASQTATAVTMNQPRTVSGNPGYCSCTVTYTNCTGDRVSGNYYSAGSFTANANTNYAWNSSGTTAKTDFSWSAGGSVTCSPSYGKMTVNANTGCSVTTNGTGWYSIGSGYKSTWTVSNATKYTFSSDKTTSTTTYTSASNWTASAGGSVASPTVYVRKYNVTVTKNTGISTIYYKINGASSWSSTTSSTTISPDYDSTVYWYATAATGYTGNDIGTSSSPKSFTMGTSGTISPTADWTEYTLTISATDTYLKSRSISRTSSPNKGAATGALSNGSKIYYGDVLSISAVAKDSTYSDSAYTPSSVAAPTMTTTGDSATANMTIANSNAFAVTAYYGTTSGATTSNTSVSASGSKLVNSGLSWSTKYYVFFRAATTATRTWQDYAVNSNSLSSNYSSSEGVKGNVTWTVNGKLNGTRAETLSGTKDSTGANITTAAQNSYTVTYRQVYSGTVLNSQTETKAYGTSVKAADKYSTSWTGSGTYAPYNYSGGADDGPKTVTGNTTVSMTYSTRAVKSYTLTKSVTGASYGTYTVNRTTSPYQGASTGELANGATIYYGDTLTGSATAGPVNYGSWDITSVTAPTVTSTGDATSGNVTATNKDSHACNLYYRTTNSAGGTQFGTNVAQNATATVTGLSFNTTYYVSAGCTRSRTKYTPAISGTPTASATVSGNTTMSCTFTNPSSGTDTGTIYSATTSHKTAAQNSYAVTITGTYTKTPYLSTSSSATSGSASGTTFPFGSTVYGFAQLNDNTSSYTYNAATGFTQISGRLYRVGSVTVATSGNSITATAVRTPTVTVTKNTGIDKIYYKMNGASSFAEWSSGKLNADRGTTVYWYATCQTGYTSTDAGSASSPNSFQQLSSAKTIAPTATLSAVNITFTKGTGINKVYYKANGASAFTEWTSGNILSNIGSTFYWYATASAGYTGNDIGSSTSPKSFTVSTAQTVNVTATRITWSLNVTMSNYVTGWRYKIDSGSWVNKTASFNVTGVDYASKVTVECTSNEGATEYNYGSYTGTGTFGSGSQSSNLSTTLACTRTRKTFTITFPTWNLNGAGTWDNNTLTCEYGDSLMLTPSPVDNGGYWTCYSWEDESERWTNNMNVKSATTSTTYRVKLDGDDVDSVTSNIDPLGTATGSSTPRTYLVRLTATPGTGVSSAFISTSSSATSGNALLIVDYGSTVYVYEVCNAGYGFSGTSVVKTSGITGRSDSIYRVTSYTITGTKTISTLPSATALCRMTLTTARSGGTTNDSSGSWDYSTIYGFQGNTVNFEKMLADNNHIYAVCNSETLATYTAGTPTTSGIAFHHCNMNANSDDFRSSELLQHLATTYYSANVYTISLSPGSYVATPAAQSAGWSAASVTPGTWYQYASSFSAYGGAKLDCEYEQEELDMWDYYYSSARAHSIAIWWDNGYRNTDVSGQSEDYGISSKYGVFHPQNNGWPLYFNPSKTTAQDGFILKQVYIHDPSGGCPDGESSSNPRIHASGYITATETFDVFPTPIIESRFAQYYGSRMTGEGSYYNPVIGYEIKFTNPNNYPVVLHYAVNGTGGNSWLTTTMSAYGSYTYKTYRTQRRSSASTSTQSQSGTWSYRITEVQAYFTNISNAECNYRSKTITYKLPRATTSSYGEITSGNSSSVSGTLTYSSYYGKHQVRLGSYNIPSQTTLNSRTHRSIMMATTSNSNYELIGDYVNTINLQSYGVRYTWASFDAGSSPYSIVNGNLMVSTNAGAEPGYSGCVGINVTGYCAYSAAS